VVDDGSRDNIAAVVEATPTSTAAQLVLIRRPAAGGRSVARNTGAARAVGTRLLFLDDDMLIDSAVLERHWHAQDRPTPVLGRATILNLPWLRGIENPTRTGTDQAVRARRLIPDAAPANVLCHAARYARRSRFEADLHALLAAQPSAGGCWLAATGGNLSVSRQFFQQIGGFDPLMGMRWGLEDLEFGFRAERHGATLVHFTDVAAYHMDHEVAAREADHQIALRYFREKHGGAIGDRLAAYFAGELNITEVVRP
jgi:GT2 family glycosyltransferase